MQKDKTLEENVVLVARDVHNRNRTTQIISAIKRHHFTSSSYIPTEWLDELEELNFRLQYDQNATV